MPIGTETFLIVLFVYLIFVLIRREFRAGWLMIVSLGYVFYLNKGAGIVLPVCILVTYEAGILIGRGIRNGKKKEAKRMLAGTSTFLILLLAAAKYSKLFLSGVVSKELLNDSLSFLFPIGFSFLIFQAIGYLADVYRGETEEEKSLTGLILFFLYFPKYCSGPVEKKERFMRQVQQAEAVGWKDWSLLRSAVSYCVYGLFLKVTIADRMGKYATTIFIRYEDFTSLTILLGVLFYTVQIYCDFAGYSYIAIGISKLFGIRLSDNFNMPYTAVNIRDFWKRWHISLSSFLRDNLYIPLGGSRKGTARKYLNTMIVFLICGMWHGEEGGFIVWGLLHGLYSIIDGEAQKRGWKWFRSGVSGRVITLLEVSFAWIFFRCKRLEKSIRFLRFIAARRYTAEWFKNDMAVELNIGRVETTLIIVFILLLFIAETIMSAKKKSIPEAISETSIGKRWTILYCLILAAIIFGFYGPEQAAGTFLYMNF